MTFMNNETVGISAEVAIANVFDVDINPEYIDRADEDVVELLEFDLDTIFRKEGIPLPIEHVAEEQNPVDFVLEDGSTLSVKTNKKSLGKVAPQIIGQPTSQTYFEYFDDFIDFDVPETYEEKIELFKQISINEIETVIEHYWNNLFECEHLLYFYNIIDKNGNIKENYKYIYVRRPTKTPAWNNQKFRFTQSLDTWIESCTVRCITDEGKTISIGEFQAHRNRNCLKFRFNMRGVLKLIKSELL